MNNFFPLLKKHSVMVRKNIKNRILNYKKKIMKKSTMMFTFYN